MKSTVPRPLAVVKSHRIPVAALAIICVLGFLLTVWLLADAEITMQVAHHQWEIRQNVAFELALLIWLPIGILMLLVGVMGHLIRKRGRSSR